MALQNDLHHRLINSTISFGPQNINGFVNIEASIVAIIFGQGWTSQMVFEDVADNAYVYVSMRTGSKQALLEVSANSEGKAYFNSYEGTTWTVDGTSNNVFNRRIGWTGTSETTVYYGGTVDTLGDPRFVKLILGGTGPLSTGGSASIPKTSILPPNSELTLTIQNVSGLAKDISLSIEWAEIEVVE